MHAPQNHTQFSEHVRKKGTKKSPCACLTFHISAKELSTFLLHSNISRSFKDVKMVIFSIFIMILINSIYGDISAEDRHYSFFDELFGDGLSVGQVLKESKRHLASSIEDLKILSDIEKNVILKNEDFLGEMLFKYKESIGDFECFKR